MWVEYEWDINWKINIGFGLIGIRNVFDIVELVVIIKYEMSWKN